MERSEPILVLALFSKAGGSGHVRRRSPHTRQPERCSVGARIRVEHQRSQARPCRQRNHGEYCRRTSCETPRGIELRHHAETAWRRGHAAWSRPYRWGRIAERTGRAHANVADACARAMALTDHPNRVNLLRLNWFCGRDLMASNECRMVAILLGCVGDRERLP